ncbi:MAG: sensor histidine kinase [Allosphingosinicella sp.]
MNTSDMDLRRPWTPSDSHCVTNGPDARLRLAALSTIAAILVREISRPIAAATDSLHGCARRLHAPERNDDDLLSTIEHAGREMVKAGEILRRMDGFIATGRIDGRTESLTAMVETAGRDQLCPDGVAVSIETAIGPGADLVAVDRILIEQVFTILFENACEALAGRDDRRIAIRASRLGKNVELRIQDNGPGLTDYQFVHLFDPLFTAKARGMGLQLPICRTIVEAHGGRLRAERPAADGTTFALTLPAAD